MKLTEEDLDRLVVIPEREARAKNSKSAYFRVTKRQRRLRVEGIVARNGFWSCFGAGSAYMRGRKLYAKTVIKAIVKALAPGVENPGEVFKSVIQEELDYLTKCLEYPIRPRPSSQKQGSKNA